VRVIDRAGNHVEAPPGYQHFSDRA